MLFLLMYVWQMLQNIYDTGIVADKRVHHMLS